MKLRITHITQYNYEEPVTDSVNELRLTPIIDEQQRYLQHSIKIKPSVPLFSYSDYFGNTTHYFTINSPHKHLLIKMDSIVETNLREQPKKSKLSYKEELNILNSSKSQNTFAEYLMETAYTIITPELITFVKQAIDEKKIKNTYQLLEQISTVIYKQFTYDQQATNVHTTLADTLQLKRGVCQDYAHLMIAICRIFNLPARYISGYHFIGDVENNQSNIQHASHAWIEAYIPLVGWVGFDPTNNGVIDWRYVKLSHGRDYSDISPVKGIYKGTSSHRLNVLVDIQYLNDQEEKISC